MEEVLGYRDSSEAYEMENRARGGSLEDRKEIIDRVMLGLVPELPKYKKDDHEVFFKRIIEEGKGAIFATNPPLSTGIVADRLVLQLLKEKGEKRDIVYPPEMPGYLYFDAATMVAKVVTERWW